MNKKILILYTSVGLGHKSIAENIGFYLSAAGYEVKLEDVLEVQSGKLVNFGKKIHRQLITNFSFAYSFMYNSKWFSDVTLSMRTKVAAKNYQKTKAAMDSFKPDLVIATQTSASAILDFLKQKGLYKGKFAIAFSDFHLHRYWLYGHADFYLANIDEQKEQMVNLGTPANKIFVCGMVLKPKIEVNIVNIKNKFNIEAEDKVVLIGSGSQGTGVDEILIEKFISLPRLKVMVACGKNKELQEKLNNEFKGKNIIVLGYYSPMEELYAVADIFITKPGGLSVSEALRWNLPILVSHMLPGQEQHNVDYLLKKEYIMPLSKNLFWEAMQELTSGAFRQSLKNNHQVENLFDGREALLDAVNKNLGKSAQP